MGHSFIPFVAVRCSARWLYHSCEWLMTKMMSLGFAMCVFPELSRIVATAHLKELSIKAHVATLR
jgi:mannose/fructose/N-acetylgalactosamine-specific phosphotransferase system component IID